MRPVYAAHSDDRQSARPTDDPCAQVDGRLSADKIQRHSRAPRSDNMADHFDGFFGIAGVYGVVRAERASMGKLLIIDVASDQPGRRQSFQNLDCHVAEPANANDDHIRIGRQQRQGRLDRMVGRQGCVTERRGPDRIELAQRHEQARRRNDHVFGHAAIETEPATRGGQASMLLAIIFRRCLASMTAATSPRPIDCHCVALPPAGHALPERSDMARILVTKREGDGKGGVVEHMQIVVADTGACHA